ncbi:MAG: hypothetical protein ACOZAA_17350 [Pseudomonadota bacterium]
MLAAIEAVAKADTVWASGRRNSNVAAEAAAGESIHTAFPPKPSTLNGGNRATVTPLRAAHDKA